MANRQILPPPLGLPLAAFLFFTLLSFASAEARKPLVYGISQKPFPLIASLEYPLCRAQAWLAALDLAVTYMPAPLLTRLRSAGFDTPLARLALAALLCPLDVVTPENANSEKIRVFLKWPDNPLDEGLAILEKTSILQMEMAFIWEIRQAATELREIWPATVADGRKLLARMEVLARELTDLWQAVIFNSEEFAGKLPLWSSSFQKNTRSAALAIASAAAALPDTATALTQALGHLLDRETPQDEDAALWNWLAARTLLLRGKVYSRRDSTALAESDFRTAIARLQKTDQDTRIVAQAWLDLGEIYRGRGELAKMCSALENACASGECQRLSFARRSKLCEPTLK